MGDFTERTGPPERTQLAERSESLLLETLRREYRTGELTEANCETNPIRQFQRWMKDARATENKEPNAMTLATATCEGKPSARIVLLKELTEIGFVFYTNYQSRKGQEVETNPFAALTFYWPELERQVRVEGQVGKVSAEKSAVYFRGRPKGSRLGALASNQSRVVSGREELETRLRDLKERYADTDDVPVPECWGGYQLVPDIIEFWQGKPNRMHDRIRYRRNGEDGWFLERLAP